tara:strand:- start:472 stop:627 length:156 start_codon:yes stop_codon:yes gene_type:complete
VKELIRYKERKIVEMICGVISNRKRNYLMVGFNVYTLVQLDGKMVKGLNHI